MEAIINGKNYSWSDVTVTIFGTPLLDITAINYTSRQEKTNIYGRGTKPVGRTKGREEFEASITLNQAGFERLQSSLGRGQKLTDIPPFTITVSYGSEISTGAVVPTVDKLIDCEFSEIPKGMTNEDPNMTVELALLPLDIKYNQ